MYRKYRLSDTLSIYKSLDFPKIFLKHSSKRYKVTLGIGGNIGDVKRRFKHLLISIKRDKSVDLIQTSLILKNPPFGYHNQDDFFNSIIVLKTDKQPREFLDYLMRLEKKFARKRSFSNAPRTLDLDIIFFDERVIKTDKLTIPHAMYLQRESVLIPLAGLK
jgi:2-amino-4-hydroxy-6-hydroxymethyldihydropteridine diphosphokinase